MSIMRPSRKRVYESGATKRKTLKKELAEVELRKQIYQKYMPACRYTCTSIHRYIVLHMQFTQRKIFVEKGPASNWFAQGPTMARASPGPANKWATAPIGWVV